MQSRLAAVAAVPARFPVRRETRRETSAPPLTMEAGDRSTRPPLRPAHLHYQRYSPSRCPSLLCWFKVEFKRQWQFCGRRLAIFFHQLQFSMLIHPTGEIDDDCSIISSKSTLLHTSRLLCIPPCRLPAIFTPLIDGSGDNWFRFSISGKMKN